MGDAARSVKTFGATRSRQPPELSADDAAGLARREANAITGYDDRPIRVEEGMLLKLTHVPSL
jgi:hypothetical protein